MPDRLIHVSLFTGIGGFDLACDWLGIETVLQCEIDPYCLKVLARHWPNVRRIHDVREVTALAYAEARENHRRNRGELAEAQGRGWSGNAATVSGSQDAPWLLTGGFPCQPFSCAGKRKGKTDNRYLWPEMLRVIKELRPTWVIAENVAGLASMVQFDSPLEVDNRTYTPEEMASGHFDVGEVRGRWGRGILCEVLEDLAEAGYDADEVPVVPACAVNAPHRRDRVWIVAHAEGRTERAGLCAGEPGGQRRRRLGDEGGEDAADAGYGRGEGTRGCECRGPDPAWWQSEPDVGRVATGIPARVDRLKCLGNAIVPQVAYEVIRAMLDA